MKLYWGLLPLFLFTINCSKFEANKQGLIANSFVQDCGTMTERACQTMYWVNYQRILHSLEPLEINDNCTEGAFAHARDMDAFDYFDHDGRNETWEERYDRFNVRGIVAENIAEYPSPQEAVIGWMNSPGHRANILAPDLTSGGIGVAGNIYVQCFSSEVD